MAGTIDTGPADYSGLEELPEPVVPALTPLIGRVRSEVVARRLTAVSPRTTVAHLALAWGPALALAVVGVVAREPVVWVVAWSVIAWAMVGNAAIGHEAVHGHLFASRRWNTLVGTVALVTILGSFATFRCFHLEHHARTGREGDPERTPLNFSTRRLYLAVMILGGVLVLFENSAYTLVTIIGRPPRWVRADRQRRAVRVNALVLLAVVAGLVAGLVVDPWLVIDVWVVPYLLGVCVVLPVLLVPEHYGATGRDGILETTRSIRSNAFVRWAYWNNNFHAAHHLVPAVPYDKIGLVDELLEEEGMSEPRWRLRSYTQFHLGLLGRLAFNRPEG